MLMKNVSLITIHVGSNFGSNLQTIATCEILKKMNCNTIVINYIPERCTFRRFCSKRSKSIFTILTTPISAITFLLNRKIYHSFLKKYVTLSSPIYSKDNFIDKCPKADIYITGSDQVWNSIHNEGLDVRYYFDGFPKGIKKIAYSSSIGREKLGDSEYAEVKRMLGSYKAISVREVSAQAIIASMGYHVSCLLDPTFMLDKLEWVKYMSKRFVKEAYILVYLPYNIHNKGLIYKSVRQIAQSKNLKVVAFSWTMHQEKLADTTIYFASPGDFLSLMYYADVVITNSFHGTAFSINLNKLFYVYLPTGFGTRIMSILQLCSLEHRLLKPEEIISKKKIDDEIDYKLVNTILDGERMKTYTFLNKALNE